MSGRPRAWADNKAVLIALNASVSPIEGLFILGEQIPEGLCLSNRRCLQSAEPSLSQEFSPLTLIGQWRDVEHSLFSGLQQPPLSIPVGVNQVT